MKVFIQCPDSLLYYPDTIASKETELAIGKSVSGIRIAIRRGESNGEISVPIDLPHARPLSWVAYPLWWSNHPEWWKAPFPWENPFLRRI